VKFVLEITLEDAAARNHHDVAAALRKVATKLSGYVSRDPAMPNLEGKITDCNGNAVIKWEVKEPRDDDE
jgi:hypothetical protein